jgi:hypothetical protein
MRMNSRIPARTVAQPERAEQNARSSPKKASTGHAPTRREEHHMHRRDRRGDRSSAHETVAAK